MIYQVIDNFFEDPVAERALALSQEYMTIDHVGMKYPGIAKTVDDKSFEKIGQLLGIDPAKEKNCFYRRYLPGEEQSDFIHNDSQSGTFSAIVFLTLPEHCYGGVAFWKHRLLGWELAPFGVDEVWHRRVYEDGDKEEMWEMIEYVPMQFNRCVVFFSPRFHSRYPKVGSGETTEECRLIKTFFYKL